MAVLPSRKVFCIGLNKTGTTSLSKYMERHGFTCSDQIIGELLLTKYASGDHREFLDHCKSAEFFQDIPFRIPGCHKILMKAFPEAKFILTLRNSAEVWYKSLVTYHRKVFGVPLDSHQLKAAKYRYPGFAWEANRILYSSPPSDPYKKENLISDYETHKAQVMRDFAGKENLLVVCIEDPEAPHKISEFLNLEMVITKMPWLNKTEKT